MSQTTSEAVLSAVTVTEHSLETREYVRVMTTQTLKRFVLALPAFCLLLLLIFFVNPQLAQILTVGSLLGALLGVFTLSFFLRAMYTLRAKDPENASLFRPRTVVFRPHELEVRLDGKANHLKWENFQRATLESGCLMLHLSRTQQLLIPVRAFATPADRQAAEAILREAGLLG